MADHTGVWAKLVYPLLVHGAHKVRERAMVAMEMGLSAMMQHQMEFNKNLEDDLKTVIRIVVYRPWCIYDLTGRANLVTY